MIVGTVILAAGESTISNIPMIQKEIDVLRKVGMDKIVLVTGFRWDVVEKELVHRKITCIKNPEYKKSEMLDSVKLGIEKLQGEVDKILIIPSDIPFFSEDTLSRVMAEKEDVVIPVHKGELGHPISISKKVFKNILDYEGKEGLRGAIEKNNLKVKTIEVLDKGVLIETNTEKEYEEGEDYQREQLLSIPLELQLNISIGRKKTFLTREVIDFLKAIDVEKSMNGACKKMKISYSRGWTMVNTAETKLQKPLINRKTGGEKGGSSSLTKNAIIVIEKYEKLEKEIYKASQKIFNNIFQEK